MIPTPGRQLRAAIAALWLCAGGSAAGVELERHPEIERFIDDVAARHDLPRQDLRELFRGASIRPEVVEAMERPSERLPWHRYRDLFVTGRTIDDGVRFWRRHEETLERARRRYGVPPAVIVAIIGIESRYGANMGTHAVLDSLTTLAFTYPRRAAFFQRELEEFLVLAHEEALDPARLRGSYAGAMGVPQFIASSYRHYAIDFDGDGRRDLIDTPVDAIGSVAHYLYVHRWRPGEPVADMVETDPGAQPADWLRRGLETHHTVAELVAAGIRPQSSVPAHLPASLVRLDGADGAEYRAAYANFYVITRYNRSILYAMAVHDLSREIERGYGGQR